MLGNASWQISWAHSDGMRTRTRLSPVCFLSVAWSTALAWSHHRLEEVLEKKERRRGGTKVEESSAADIKRQVKKERRWSPLEDDLPSLVPFRQPEARWTVSGSGGTLSRSWPEHRSLRCHWNALTGSTGNIMSLRTLPNGERKGGRWWWRRRSGFRQGWPPYINYSCWWQIILDERGTFFERTASVVGMSESHRRLARREGGGG